MTPEAFRKDRYLRATGYNFFVWAAVNLLVTAPLFSALGGRPWPEWLGLVYPIALIATGIFVCVLNDNRVQKMVGDPAPVPVVEAGSIWLPVLLLGILFTVLFVARGPLAFVQPLWLCLVGTGYLQWGNFTIREFRLFGAVLIAAGVVAGFAVSPAEIGAGMPSFRALVVWVVFMSVAWIPFGAYINRKYVHIH